MSHVSSQQFQKLIEIAYRYINEKIHDCINNFLFPMQNDVHSCFINHFSFVNLFLPLISIMTKHDSNTNDDQWGNIIILFNYGLDLYFLSLSLSLVNLFLFHEIYWKKYLRKKDIWHKVYIMMEVKRKWHSSFKKGNGNLLTMCYCMKFKCMYIYTIWKMFYYNCWIRWMNLSLDK